MKKSVLLAATLLVSTSSAFAKQSLQAAMVQNPKIAALVEAVKAASGVDCLTTDTFQSEKIYGPQGKRAITQQAACFDPDAFNPTQLGQLIVTYYGAGESDTSPVGEVIEVQYEVFK